MTTIKNAIKTKLETLQQAGTLGTVVVDDFKSDGFGLLKNVGVYPAAIVGSGQLEGRYDTNSDNMRTYSFEILVMEKGENVSSMDQIETLMEAIVDAFDNDFTLGGAANGGVEPSGSVAEALSTPEGSFVIFSIMIRARGIAALDF